MADNKTFHLPDLGEGLPDATIVEWLVKEGDRIELDAPLVSMETAKAVVEVPSPYTGKVLTLHGAAGDVINTGAALAEFELDPKGRQRAENAAGGHHHAPAAQPETASPPPRPSPASGGGGESVREGSGTVVGAVASSDEVRSERLAKVGGVKAVPAVRALAKKLKVDLARVPPSGAGGVVTLKDVKQAAASGASSAGSAPSPQPGLRQGEAAAAAETSGNRSTLAQSGRPMRTRPPTTPATGQPEPLKGVRRNMARVMADAHARVVATTSMDDADIHQWIGHQDITVRLVRAVVTACKAVPLLNAWFDDDNLTLTRHPQVDLGIAMDTPDGLLVPALRNADVLDAQGVRAGVERLRQQVQDRSIAASELTGYTISLSNYGVFGAGRYGSPVVVPPCVAIVGAGRVSHDVVAVMGGIEVHRRIPISVTFDHRAATGGDAARFLKALIEDLALSN